MDGLPDRLLLRRQAARRLGRTDFQTCCCARPARGPAGPMTRTDGPPNRLLLRSAGPRPSQPVDSDGRTGFQTCCCSAASLGRPAARLARRFRRTDFQPCGFFGSAPRGSLWPGGDWGSMELDVAPYHPPFQPSPSPTLTTPYPTPLAHHPHPLRRGHPQPCWAAPISSAAID
jgi:hypothetical protein